MQEERSRSGGVVAVTLAAALALVWLLWTPDPIRVEPIPRPDASTSERTKVEPAARAPEARPAPEASGRSLLDPSPTPADSGRLEVVSGRTGEPLAGVEVRWMEVERLGLVIARDGDVGGEVERRGTRETTDAQGRIAFAHHGPAFVRARSGALWGERMVLAPLGSTRLELWPDLVVEVVDRPGRAREGVPIAVRAGGAELQGFRLRRETDREGRVRFTHYEVRGEGDTRNGSRRPPRSIEVGIDSPVAEVRKLRSDEIPEEPLRFEVGPSGSVRVELLDENGAPFRGLATARLLTPREFEELEREAGQGLPPEEIGRPFEDGSLRFPWIALGGRFHCMAWIWSRDAGERVNYDEVLTRLGQEVVGPLRADEEVRVTLRIGSGGPVLVGRLVDERGNPVRSEAWMGTVEVRQPEDPVVFEVHPDPYSFRTDADGRFSLPLEGGALADYPRGLRLRPARGRGPSREAWVDLSGPLPVGMRELGDLVVELGASLARGRVLDANGRPLADVDVELIDGNRLDGGGSYRGFLELPSATTDARGRFDLRGHALPGAYALLAHKAGYRALSPGGVGLRAIELGQTDIELVLAQNGAIEGGVRLDPEFTRYDLCVSLYLDGAQRSGARKQWVCAPLPGASSPDIAFRWNDLPPGRYTLDVELASDPKPVHSVAFPIDGEHEPEPIRLDLRGRLRAFELEILGADGRPLASATVSVPDTSGEAPPYRYCREEVPVQDGRARLILIRPMDVRIGAPGYRTETLARVFEDRRVVLVPE